MPYTTDSGGVVESGSALLFPLKGATYMKRKSVPMPAYHAHEIPIWLMATRRGEAYKRTVFRPSSPQRWGEGIVVSR